MHTFDKFHLNGKVAVITGGAGLLGVKHAEVIAEAGGIPVLWDIKREDVEERCKDIINKYNAKVDSQYVDITSLDSIREATADLLCSYKNIDILINNASNNPKIGLDADLSLNRLEKFQLGQWNDDIAVGLTGAFLCSQVIGSHMAENDGGVILNIASDLGVIAPDQRIYRKEKRSDNQQPVKPVTYSVIKHGIIGLTKYLATYWAERAVRVNSISPGGVYADQPQDFIVKLTKLIPMGRMANQDEYKAAILFLVSDASSYMTGANLIIDGGRTCW